MVEHDVSDFHQPIDKLGTERTSRLRSSERDNFDSRSDHQFDKHHSNNGRQHSAQRRFELPSHGLQSDRHGRQQRHRHRFRFVNVETESKCERRSLTVSFLINQ